MSSKELIMNACKGINAWPDQKELPIDIMWEFLYRSTYFSICLGVCAPSTSMYLCA